METLLEVILTPDEWTPESGLVTAAQKIQRSAIAKKFSKEIDVSYLSSLSLLKTHFIRKGGVQTAGLGDFSCLLLGGLVSLLTCVLLSCRSACIRTTLHY